MSAAYADKGAGGLRQRSLWEGLGLQRWECDSGIPRFADRAGVSAARQRNKPSADCGLSLHAYQSHVFLDWRELHSTAEKPWDRLCDSSADAASHRSTTR